MAQGLGAVARRLLKRVFSTKPCKERQMAVSLKSRFARLYASLLVIAASWIFLFRNEFRILESQWSQDDFSYCYLVPVVAAYVAWQKRSEIATNLGGHTWPGFVGILFSGLLLLAGRLGALETFIFLAVWLSLVSISLVLIGWRSIAQIAFPALLLLFIVPPPAFVEQVLSFNLRLISSSMSAQLLQAISVPVFLEGNIIDLGTIKLQVVDACSGLRYLLPTIFLSLIIGYMLNKRLLSRVVLALLSAPVAIALNIFRITVTGLLVRYISPSLAEGFFHDFQGWLIYLGAVALLTLASLFIKRFEKSGPVGVTENTTELTSAVFTWDHLLHPKALHLGLSIAGVFVALSFGVSSLVGAQLIPTWKSFDTFPMQIGEWKGTRSYLDKATLDSLWADDYILASYTNTTSGSIAHLLVPYYRMQTSQHTAHAPTSCLLGSGWEIDGRRVLPPSAATGRDFMVQQLILTKGGERLLSNFWFQQRGRIITSEFLNKLYLLYDSIAKHRTDGALVRIEVVIARGVSIDEAQVELDAFSGQVESRLRTYLPN